MRLLPDLLVALLVLTAPMMAADAATDRASIDPTQWTPSDRAQLRLMSDLARFARINLGAYLHIRDGVLGEYAQLSALSAGSVVPPCFGHFFTTYRQHEALWRQAFLRTDRGSDTLTDEVSLRRLDTMEAGASVQGSYDGVLPRVSAGGQVAWRRMEDALIASSRQSRREFTVAQRPEATKRIYDDLERNESAMDAALADIHAFRRRIAYPYTWDELADVNRATAQGLQVRHWLLAREQGEISAGTTSSIFACGDDIQHLWKMVGSFTAHHRRYEVEFDVVFLKVPSAHGVVVQFNDVRLVQWRMEGGSWVGLDRYLSAVAGGLDVTPITDIGYRTLVERCVARALKDRVENPIFFMP
jgi:hypothetical protein